MDQNTIFLSILNSLSEEDKIEMMDGMLQKILDKNFELRKEFIHRGIILDEGIDEVYNYEKLGQYISSKQTMPIWKQAWFNYFGRNPSLEIVWHK